MDILFQYLNIKKQKQDFIKVTDVPCFLLSKAIEAKITDKAVLFTEYMQQTYQTPFLFVGIIDAKYCNRIVRAVFSYVDFCQLTCGLGGSIQQ